MKKNNKGFTLAEMLIVVAIIGVLIAIMVPTFTNQVEKAKEATDAANIRTAISEVTNAYLTDGDLGKTTTTTTTSNNSYNSETKKRTTSSAATIASANVGANIVYYQVVDIKQGKAGWKYVTEDIAGYSLSKIATAQKGDVSKYNNVLVIIDPEGNIQLFVVDEAPTTGVSHGYVTNSGNSDNPVYNLTTVVTK